MKESFNNIDKFMLLLMLIGYLYGIYYICTNKMYYY